VVLPGVGLISAQAETRGEARTAYTQVKMDPADYPRAYQKKDEGLGQTFLSADGHIESLYGKSAYKVIDPPEGAEVINLELQFGPGRTVTGRVVDPDGKPLPGVTAAGLTATYDRPLTLKEATFTAVALDPEQPRT